MSHAGTTSLRRRGAAILLLLCGGCVPAARVSVTQNFAPPAQRNLELSSDRAFCTEDAQGQQFVLEFPLPRYPDGPSDFRLFLDLPAGSGEFAVGTGLRGFFIQEVGTLRGKTELASGTVSRDALAPDPRRRQVRFELICTDGTILSGAAHAWIDPLRMRRFRREFANDIAALTPASQPAEPVSQTGPRVSVP